MVDWLLVPLDGSPEAETALPLAAILPDRLVYLLRVVPAEPAHAPDAVFGADDEYLERVAAGVATPGREVEVLLARGDPGRRIVEAAVDVNAVVMTTHGRGGARRALPGSVADHVVRHAPAPVLLVPRDYPAPRPAVSRVVVSLDRLPRAETALPLAVSLAQHLALPLDLVGVSERADPVAERYLDEQVRCYGDAGAVRAVLRTGEVVPRLLDELDAGDFVVMTTRGQHGVRRALGAAWPPRWWATAASRSCCAAPRWLVTERSLALATGADILLQHC